MNKKNVIAVLVLLGTAALPAVCFAWNATPGGYASFFLGSSAPEDTSVTVSEFNPVAVKDARTQFDAAGSIGGTLGYDFGFVRVEGEMSYKRGDIASVTEPAFGARYVNVDGHVGAFAMMMNGFFDIHNQSPVTPYLGAGMGFASLSLSNTRGVDATTGAINSHIFGDDNDNVFAYQVGGGLDVYLNRVMSLDVGYRYFGTSRGSLRKDWPNSTDLKLASHNATVGLKVRF